MKTVATKSALRKIRTKKRTKPGIVDHGKYVTITWPPVKVYRGKISSIRLVRGKANLGKWMKGDEGKRSKPHVMSKQSMRGIAKILALKMKRKGLFS